MAVVIPDGLLASDVMAVESSRGMSYELVVPYGCSGGMTIEVDLPADEESNEQSAMEQVEIVVPPSVRSGEPFSVEFGGRVFEIICPDGCGGGSTIVVELPASNSEVPPDAPAAEHDAPANAVPADYPYKFKPGQRVELWRSDGAESPGYIVAGFEGVFDVCYKVKLDNGLFKEAVPEEEISEKVTGDVGDLFDGWG
jgi:hypothetical protein